MQIVLNVIALVCTAIAVIFTWVARRNLRAFRSEMHKALHDIDNDDDEADAEPEPEPIILKKVTRVNGARSTRVSE